MTKMMRTTKSNKKVIEEANRDKAKSFFFFVSGAKKNKTKRSKSEKKKRRIKFISYIFYMVCSICFCFFLLIKQIMCKKEDQKGCNKWKKKKKAFWFLLFFALQTAFKQLSIFLFFDFVLFFFSFFLTSLSLCFPKNFNSIITIN